MPYINQIKRKRFQDSIDLYVNYALDRVTEPDFWENKAHIMPKDITDGELNYVISSIIVKYLAEIHPKEDYFLFQSIYAGLTFMALGRNHPSVPITDIIYLLCCRLRPNNVFIDYKPVLLAAAAEFYRRVVAPYEDGKCRKNGDVFETERY